MLRIYLFLYSILYTIFLALYLPVYLYRTASERRKPTHLLQRVGRLPFVVREEARRASFSTQRRSATVWIHAVSVGEINVVKPLVDRLALNPEQLFISTSTETGQELGQNLFRNRARIFYFPLDWKWVCRRYLRSIRPSVVLLTETEIWPGFITAAKSLKIPILLINGRISDASFRRYQRIRFLLTPLLVHIDHFCMQSRQDKERLLKLGAPAPRVHWIGNLKYDCAMAECAGPGTLVETLAQTLKSGPDDLLWVCGSTQDGEERMLLDVFASLREDFPSFKLLLAPRHPHRVDSVARLVEARHLTYVKRSQLQFGNISTSPTILLLDSIGELSCLYQLADVVFIGGSLVPRGGHNIIEAAHFGKAILFGPHMKNFQEISESFLESYAALQVRSTEELRSRINDLLQDPAARNWLGRNARKVIRDNQGAVRRTVEIVREYLS